jgi:hypothetical protein
VEADGRRLGLRSCRQSSHEPVKLIDSTVFPEQFPVADLVLRKDRKRFVLTVRSRSSNALRRPARIGSVLVGEPKPSISSVTIG